MRALHGGYDKKVQPRGEREGGLKRKPGPSNTVFPKKTENPDLPRSNFVKKEVPVQGRDFGVGQTKKKKKRLEPSRY